MKRFVPVAALMAGMFTIAVPTPSSAVASSKQLPQVVIWHLEPSEFPATGGTTYVIATVIHASTCRIWGPVANTSVSCANGHVSFREHVPGDPSDVDLRYGARITALNKYGSVTTVRKWIQVDAAPRSSETTTTTTPAHEATPPVVNLDACTPGPNCDYGPIYSAYQTWGNVAPAVLGDCTFAAAANWEHIVLGVTPDPTLIGYQFATAGGSATAGLAQSTLFSWWETQGIGGFVATSVTRYADDETSTEDAVLRYKALIVELQFTANDGFAQYTVAAGTHDVVVDGFTPEGPLVVTWGETLQMSWAQWNLEIVGMWGITT